jgi:hypothetical protein
LPNLNYSWLLALLLLLPEELSAQRWWRQAPGPWSGEILLRSSILLDDEVLYVGGRIGYTLTPKLRIGLTLVVLTEEATRRTFDGIETINHLASIGPNIEYSDQLRGRLDYYVSLAGGIGYGRRERTEAGSEILNEGVFVSVEPEIGLLARFSRRFHFRIGLGALAGRVEDSEPTIYGGPSATFAMRINL